MNNQEQTLIDELFWKLKNAEATGSARDASVEAHINELVRRQPAAPYYMAQAIVVQEAAVNQLNQQLRERDEQIRQLQAQVRSTSAPAPASGGGGFLSGLFGGGQASRDSAPRPASGGGWNEPGSPAPQAALAAVPAKGSGFLGSALQTAAGVAGGVMLAQGISSLFGHHSAPQEIVEVIQNSPSSGFAQEGWGNRDQDYQAYDDSAFDDDDSFS